MWGVLVSDCFLGLSYSEGEWKRKQVAGSAMVCKHDVDRQWPLSDQMKNQLKKILGKRQGERDLTTGLRMRSLPGKKLLQEKRPLEKHLAGEMGNSVVFS